jgi:hypothetical protein
LREEHTDYVTPRTEGSRHGIHAGLARKFRNQMRRNQIAKLSHRTVSLDAVGLAFLFITFVE